MVEPAGNFNIESFIDNVAANFGKSDIEEKKVTQSSVRIHTRSLADKRQERIKNLIDQMKGAHGGGGGCFKVLKVVAKVVDFLTKPLSMITLGQLKTDLGKTLEMLQEAKNQKKVLGIKINGESILKSLQGLKKLLSEDMETLKSQDEKSAKETERILHIIDEIHNGFRTSNKV